MNFFSYLYRPFSTTCDHALPPIIHNISPIKSPEPYYRTHIIKSNSNVVKSLIDTLNSKPYRFGFTSSQLVFHIKKNNIKIWKPTISTLVNFIGYNDNEIEKIIKQPLLNPFTIITYCQHIHETPVPIPTKLNILFNNNKLIVIDKPVGIPVHEVQKYYYNTIHEILANQLNINKNCLKPIHRLDKLTSGILIWGINSEIVSKFKDNQFWNKSKIYIARIKGRLSLNKIENTDDLVYLYPSREMIKLYKGTKTEFNELYYDPIKKESIVSAKLLTGFPHQIRIHLRNMGTPIVDDPLYGFNGKYREIKKKREDIDNEYWALLIERSKQIQLSKISNYELPCNECFSQIFKIPEKDTIGEYAICLHAWKYEYHGSPNGPYHNEHYKFQSNIPSWAIPLGKHGEYQIIEKLNDLYSRL